MLEEIKNIKTDNKSLKSFGITFSIIFLFIAGFLSFKEYGSYEVLLYISGVFLFFGFLIPRLLKPIYLIWMTFAVALGWFMTRLILSLIFYVIIAPIGITARIFGNKFLDIKRTNKITYWNNRNRDDEKSQNYKNQY